MPKAGTSGLSGQSTRPTFSPMMVSTSPTTACVSTLLSKSDWGIHAEASYVSYMNAESAFRRSSAERGSVGSQLITSLRIALSKVAESASSDMAGVVFSAHGPPNAMTTIEITAVLHNDWRATLVISCLPPMTVRVSTGRMHSIELLWDTSDYVGDESRVRSLVPRRRARFRPSVSASWRKAPERVPLVHL